MTHVDISRLTGQSLRVKVSNVESVNKFHVQLPSAPASEKIVTDFMANNDTTVSEKEIFIICLGNKSYLFIINCYHLLSNLFKY